MNPTRVIGYIRVSLEKQATDGVSLAAQRERIELYCKSHGLTLDTVHADEGISGKKAENRPGLLAAVAETRKAKGILIVYSLSRLTRSIKDLLDIFDSLEKAGANLVSLTESFETHTSMGRFAFKLFGLVAELERELIGERTKEALRHKRANGEKCGGHMPYGYALVDGKLVEHYDEQATIHGIKVCRQGGESFPVIAKRLNRDARPTRTGVPWSAKVVRDVYMRTQPR